MNKPMLILIPGLLCDRRLWSSQIEALNDYADITVADITWQSTISEMATGVLASAPERFSLAGFSLGGQVALEILRIAKERVERIALLSATRGGLLPETETAIRRAVAKIESGGFDEYLEEAYPSYFAAPMAYDAECKRIFVEMAHSVGERSGLQQMRALLAIAAPFRNLEQIECPTMIIGGREDRRTTPAAHQLLAREIPRSELILIDRAAHFAPLEKPFEVIRALKRWMTLG
jgi:pimeloyl-ACP methyl ester carboxylesterase